MLTATQDPTISLETEHHQAECRQAGASRIEMLRFCKNVSGLEAVCLFEYLHRLSQMNIT